MRKFYRIIIEDEALKEELFNDKFDKKHNVNHLTAYSKLPPPEKKRLEKSGMSRVTIPPRTVQRNNIVFHKDQCTTQRSE